MPKHHAEPCKTGITLIVRDGCAPRQAEYRFSMPLVEARILRDSLISAIAVAEKRCDPRRERIDVLRAEIATLEAELGGT